MELQIEQQTLIEILYYALHDMPAAADIKEKLTADMLDSVYRLAKKQGLAQVVSQFVYQNQIQAEPQLQARLQQQELMAVYRCEQMKYAFGEICRVLDGAGIPYIPLKGSVIRPFYPSDIMRTSCDIDVLVHETDLEAAICALEAKGYCRGQRNYHDISLFSPNKIHLELHFNLQENIDSLDAILKNAWEYAVPAEGCRYDFQKEFFVFHMYAHMAYHFLSGGCGLRSLMDVWIMEHRMGASYMCAQLLLEKAGLDRFAAEMCRIADLFFTENKREYFADLVLNYICAGGMYGSRENKSAMQKRKTGNSVHYVFKRLFLPYKSMMILYPVLEKVPYLLPFFWVRRWFKAIFGGKSSGFAAEVASVRDVSEDRAAEVKAICTRLGL